MAKKTLMGSAALVAALVTVALLATIATATPNKQATASKQQARVKLGFITKFPVESRAMRERSFSIASCCRRPASCRCSCWVET